ncbi:MAG TPA: transposase [Gemmataceae bacterium]|nr:transposase [Gemmataceae bacterium]
MDYAHALKDLADIHFLNVKKIVLVQDNLNTHTKASLYEAFPAAEARRLAERFEWHYTPKHGSWLNMAESELGALSSQCLDRRIPDKQTLIDEIAAWDVNRLPNLTPDRRLGKTIAIPITPRPTGSSPQPMLGLNSSIYTRQSD